MEGTAQARLFPVLDFLRNPAHHADHSRTIEVRETHISWVVLTDRFAYKVKKPVRFSFLDFSTLERRRAACADELRLNRRMAPDVYADLVYVGPLTPHTWGWVHEGMEAEPIVKMKRLPDEASLATRLARRDLSDKDVGQLADYLAAFYTRLPPLTLCPEPVREALAERIRQNQADLLVALPDQIQRIGRIHAALLRYTTTHAELLDGRVCDGRFVEGHGDLRPEHVYLLHPPAVIDCVEFSAEFRQVDILDDLAFLAMECDRAGHPDVGTQIASRYREQAGDAADPSLLSFYKMYRAVVRAKVMALRALQVTGPSRTTLQQQADEYLEWADRYRQTLGPGLLLLVTGLMGSGKSTLASAMADRLGARLVQTDQVRRTLYGVSRAPLAYGVGTYGPAARDAVYTQTLAQAEPLLASGFTVIVDGTFGAKTHREAARLLAQRVGADCVTILCGCTRPIALERIARRLAAGESASEGRVDLYDRQAHDWEADDERTVCHVDSAGPLAGQVRTVMTYLAAAWSEKQRDLPLPWRGVPRMNAQRILCPIDFSDSSELALQYAVSLAKESRARVYLVHVDETQATYDAGFAGFAVPPEQMQRAEARLAEKAATLNDVAVETHVLWGFPSDLLVEFATTHDIDLIVMGTHGRTGLARLVMGSVAEAVVRRAACPVLTVKQPAASSVANT